ncbi:hypothetical protein [Flavobacterium aurantiibacter]|uniref:Uncharacterized protein n=1 Tax=Flavobacterium aurantiibacter TaxID=2023067 RepID=A0A256ADR9_9FLAO|nr:hypothetical protein [Flavobacterium aurantiibacter]OYQ51781.1 hypothetical protein CHX27_00170 [Flavobacterium aurantiibacter]
MKKYNFGAIIATCLFLSVSSTSYSTSEVKNNKSLIINPQFKKKYTNVDKSCELYLNRVDPKLVKALVDQINYCTEIQLSVKETYTATFGPDRANDIALGAFMGCMGML